MVEIDSIPAREAMEQLCGCEPDICAWERGIGHPHVRWEMYEIHGQPAPQRPTDDDEILRAISSSAHLTELSDDWDGEGSPGYTKETWTRAITFLLSLAGSMRQQFGLMIDPPRILPSAAGSIDIHWKTDSYELLVNVPPAARQPIAYYGDNTQGNMPIERSCPHARPDRKLVAWLSLFK